tara:strand:+ start:829 stop:1578 length:750 start_codon:yes stop_codon:yes gene_type:complete
MRLNGKVAIITGASKGLGLDIAKLFAKNGSKVIITDVNDCDGLLETNKIQSQGDKASYFHLDVTSEADWSRLVSKVIKKHGKIDILVNNAGVYHRGNLEATEISDWDRVFSVNAKGVFIGTRAVLPEMKKQLKGSIVSISSIAGIIGSKQSVAYNSAKGAIRLFTKSVAVQYADQGIRANTIHPGPMETDMLNELFNTKEESEDRRTGIPLGRFATVRDVSNGVLFLSSDEASLITGSELVIDGGWTAQ